jgi:hypothetical protein
MNKVIIVASFLFTTLQIVSQEIVGIYRPKPICGEENAPENIYYKYIHNHTSNTFLYTLFSETGFSGGNSTVFMVLSVENNEGILMLYADGIVLQHSLIYYPSSLVSNIIYSLYWTKYEVESIAVADAKHYLLRQFDFDYKLIHKKELEELLSKTFPDDAEVYVDEFFRGSPYYVKTRK